MNNVEVKKQAIEEIMDIMEKKELSSEAKRILCTTLAAATGIMGAVDYANNRDIDAFNEKLALSEIFMTIGVVADIQTNVWINNYVEEKLLNG